MSHPLLIIGEQLECDNRALTDRSYVDHQTC